MSSPPSEIIWPRFSKPFRIFSHISIAITSPKLDTSRETNLSKSPYEQRNHFPTPLDPRMDPTLRAPCVGHEGFSGSTPDDQAPLYPRLSLYVFGFWALFAILSRNWS